MTHGNSTLGFPLDHDTKQPTMGFTLGHGRGVGRSDVGRPVGKSNMLTRSDQHYPVAVQQQVNSSVYILYIVYSIYYIHILHISKACRTVSGKRPHNLLVSFHASWMAAGVRSEAKRSDANRSEAKRSRAKRSEAKRSEAKQSQAKRA